MYGRIWLMKIIEFFAMLMASVLPSTEAPFFEPGVTVTISPGSNLVAEEKIQIQVGDRFSAVLVDPKTGEIYSQSDWVDVIK